MTRRRRLGSPVPASPLENDDVLTEILLRLPPAPSSLPLASCVCKRWRRLVSDRAFLRRFRAHHRRNAPLLGFFANGSDKPFFIPTLDPPDRLPPERFSLELDEGSRILDCRHGLVLILNRRQLHVLVWDPVTDDVSRVAFPPGLDDGKGPFVANGAVLCANNDVRDGDHHSIPFLVALVANDVGGTRAFACLYSSVTSLWGDIISTARSCPPMVPMMFPPSALAGGSLYWVLAPDPFGILEFDLDRQHLAVKDVPLDFLAFSRHWVMPTEGGSLGLLSLSGFNAELWMRKKGSDGVASWALGRTIELDKLLSLDTVKGFPPLVLGFAESDNAFYLYTADGVFMVQLESMQFKKACKLSSIGIYHVFASVYTAGLGIDNERGGPQELDNA